MYSRLLYALCLILFLLLEHFNSLLNFSLNVLTVVILESANVPKLNYKQVDSHEIKEEKQAPAWRIQSRGNQEKKRTNHLEHPEEDAL